MFNSVTTSNDLTTKARIRDAAIELFGRDGYAATSIRAVASAVEVSPGLVMHHFGSKEGLREACDAYVLGLAFASDAQFHDVGTTTAGLLSSIYSNIDRYRPVVAYLRRLLVDGGPSADRIFARIVEETATYLATEQAKGTMKFESDPHTMAVVLTAVSLSLVVFEQQVGRTVPGKPDSTTAIFGAVSLPIMELLTHGLYTNDDLLRAMREALSTTSSGKGTDRSSTPQNSPTSQTQTGDPS